MTNGVDIYSAQQPMAPLLILFAVVNLMYELKSVKHFWFVDFVHCDG